MALYWASVGGHCEAAVDAVDNNRRTARDFAEERLGKRDKGS